jgi:uncharacterized membrane protein
MKLTVIALLLLMPVAFAQLDRAEINANINADGSVHHVVAYYFTEPLAPGPINYTISQAIRDISASDGTQDLVYLINGSNVEIVIKNSTKVLSLTYTADNVVYHSENIHHFFTEFSFSENIGKLYVTVALPEGYVISNNFYRPTDGEVITDGKRIIVSWTELDALGKYIFAVNFLNPNENTDPFFFAFIVMLMVIIVGAVYGYKHFRKSVNDAFFRGFRDDEKKTIEYLQQKHVALQSDLQKEFGFSRAKATRIIMKLEEKKLVRKQKYGRTNRITWA